MAPPISLPRTLINRRKQSQETPGLFLHPGGGAWKAQSRGEVGRGAPPFSGPGVQTPEPQSPLSA